MSPADRIRVGVVGGVHGLRGEVRLYPSRRFHAVVPHLSRIFLDHEGPDDPREYRVTATRPHKDAILMTFAAVADRDAAGALRGSVALSPREDLEAAGAPGPYPEDFVGLAVVTRDGREVGAVEEILEYPGTDMFLVSDGEEDVLIPAVDAFLVEIDVAAGKIVIDPPDGLLDLNRENAAE